MSKLFSFTKKSFLSFCALGFLAGCTSADFAQFSVPSGYKYHGDRTHKKPGPEPVFKTWEEWITVHTKMIDRDTVDAADPMNQDMAKRTVELEDVMVDEDTNLEMTKDMSVDVEPLMNEAGMGMTGVTTDVMPNSPALDSRIARDPVTPETSIAPMVDPMKTAKMERWNSAASDLIRRISVGFGRPAQPVYILPNTLVETPHFEIALRKAILENGWNLVQQPIPQAIMVEYDAIALDLNSNDRMMLTVLLNDKINPPYELSGIYNLGVDSAGITSIGQSSVPVYDPSGVQQVPAPAGAPPQLLRP